MIKNKIPVKPFREEVLCGVCGGQGTMQMTGQTIQSKKLLYVHVCTNKECLYTDNFESAYPRIVFDEIETVGKTTPDLKKL